jgi:hypothetical protein
MKKNLDVLWVVVLGSIIVLAMSVIGARAEEQTRFYGPDGRSIGTAAPYGNGSIRFYDARGRTLGTVGHYGGQFQGTSAQLHLRPGTSVGRPTTGEHEKGEIFIDRDATLFVCVADGTPGTWRRIVTEAA